MRVLVVDDNASNRYLLRALLEGHGHSVDEARHGAEALVIAAQRRPDIAVSDLLMPVLDGFTLVRHWRSDDRLKAIPFVVYTATYTEPRDERLALALGADTFIVKPCEPDDLVKRIEATLALAASGTLPSAGAVALEESEMLKEYNAVLVRKLEKKAMDAERSNLELRDEIAEREKVEQRLRHSEERFRATFEQAAVGLAHLDTNGRFLWANATLCDMTGYSPAELLTQTWLELTAPEHRVESDQLLHDMVGGARHKSSAEARYRRKNQTVFWGNVVTTLVRDSRGIPQYFIAVLVDVTERRALEDQLRQASKMEAVGRLAGGVAHDFNNLLTIISGYSDLLLAVPGVKSPEREAVTAIREAGERAASLTRQLLGFSRQTILQPIVLDVNAVVTAVSQLLRRLIGEDIQLSTVLDPRVDHIRVDPGQFDQVLMNLAVNARDAMPTGGRLTIETGNVVLSDEFAATHVCKPGPHVKISIVDSGVGMSEDVMARIFEPFYTTKRMDKGTGLGLSMVFGIVKQSDGSIHVVSVPGHGTTFTVYFPAVDEPVARRQQPRTPARLQGSETILLVEDEAGVRALASRSLRGFGYLVLPAADGRDALRVLAEHSGPLHLILTDVVMPNVSGPELVARLKGQYPGVKVLFMSGYTDDAVVRHGLLGADVAFVQKPYSPQALAAKVRQVLDE